MRLERTQRTAADPASGALVRTGWRAAPARLAMVLALVAIAAYCRKKPGPAPATAGPRFIKLSPEAWPTLTDDFDPATLPRAIDRQLAWLEAQTRLTPRRFGDAVIDRARLRRTLTRFRALWLAAENGSIDLARTLRDEFDLYRVEWNGEPAVSITGYFAPIYPGSLTPDERFRHPLYALPDDLVELRPSRFDAAMLQPGARLRGDRLPARIDPASGEVLPYYTRREIDEAGALAGRGLELVYLDRYFHAFLFQVQGGGFVRLPDGRFLKLDYAGKNGWPYVSIGRLLVEAGAVPAEKISIPAIEKHFENNPEGLRRFCFQNPSYVFYRAGAAPVDTLTPDLFPNGSLGFPVTPTRSLALDKRWFPGGGLVLLQGRLPDDAGGSRPFSAFALDQDTGGAIRGARVDFFLGAGERAGERAGRLNDTAGRLYFFVVKENRPAGSD